MCFGGESASDVRQRYDSRIQSFMRRQNGYRGSLFSREEPMDALLAWIEGVLRERETMQNTLAQNAKKIHELESDVQDLNTKLGNMRASLARSENRGRDMEARNKALREKHIDDTAKLESQHANSMRDTVNRFTNQIKAMTASHDAERQKTKKNHDDRVVQLRREHKVEVDKMKVENGQLVGQLLVNQDEDRAWPDNKLKVKFDELQQIIGSVTSPKQNNALRLPKNINPGPELDPTGFIALAGSSKFKFLLRSGIWEILHQQFFSQPFGFGAFGLGQAQREVLDAHFPWRKIFDTPANADDFSIFYSDKLANNLRSTTFQCFSAAVLDGENRGLPTESPLCDINKNNINETIYRILNYLEQAASLSNNILRSELEVEIRKIVNIALELALQFGVQPAHLHLSTPELGQLVTMGEDFQDCEDADMKKGAEYFVELVVSPGLQKMGDGKSTKTKTRSIVACLIYPQEAGM